MSFVWPSVRRRKRGEQTRIRVALIDLDSLAMEPEDALPLLDEEELARYRRLHFGVHRARFARARACLRLMLMRLLTAPNDAISFRRGPYGKPELARKRRDAMRFNLARSGSLALYAFSRDTDVGVDLETHCGVYDVEDVAGRFFTYDERSLLRGESQEYRLSNFFDCWTLKQALVKAEGAGFALPTTAFTVNVTAESGYCLREAAFVPSRNWRFVRLSDNAPISSAIVYHGSSTPCLEPIDVPGISNLVLRDGARTDVRRDARVYTGNICMGGIDALTQRI